MAFSLTGRVNLQLDSTRFDTQFQQLRNRIRSNPLAINLTIAKGASNSLNNLHKN